MVWREGAGEDGTPNATTSAVRTTPGDVHATVEGAVTREATFTVGYEGGWSVLPPRTAARIGERSSALRVVRERLTSDDRFAVTIEGRAGAAYDLFVRGPFGSSPPAITVTPRDAVMPALRLGAPDQRGWSRLNVVFPTQGGDDDGYVALTLQFASPR
jgi:hypothetical protein